MGIAFLAVLAAVGAKQAAGGLYTDVTIPDKDPFGTSYAEFSVICMVLAFGFLVLAYLSRLYCSLCTQPTVKCGPCGTDCENMFCPVKERVRDDVRDEGAVPNARPTQIATGQPVPGFEDEGLTWEDTMDVVTINMPISADILRSLAVHTDGSTLSLSWHKGSVVINLYSQILESRTGPARVSTGIFSLPMRKAKPSMWPRLTERDQTDEHTDEPASSYEPVTDPKAAFWVRSQPTLGPVQDT